MKRSCSRLKFSAAVLALALAPGSALFAQDYEIRLDRPDPVGSKCHLAMAGKQSTSQVVKQGDKVLQDKSSKFAVEAELVATVLAVSEKGAAHAGQGRSGKTDSNRRRRPERISCPRAASSPWHGTEKSRRSTWPAAWIRTPKSR